MFERRWCFSWPHGESPGVLTHQWVMGASGLWDQAGYTCSCLQALEAQQQGPEVAVPSATTQSVGSVN